MVDDVKEQRNLAGRILTKLNYRVATVESGEDAVNYLKIKEADLILLDMIMDPGIDGLETYRRIIATNPRQKAVIASGFSESEQVLEAQRLGAGSYLRKPYTLERLAVTVKNELHKADQPVSEAT